MALKALNKVLLKIFGSRQDRLVKSYAGIVERTGAFEDQVRQLDDAALKARTAEFKAALQGGQRPEDILPEAFAVVREAARRSVEMRHFDVQIIGGSVLFEGKIAEMATGEGKTLVATLATYMVHLTGRRVHLITVNDYLAKRDAEWMAPVYNALGLTVSAIQSDMDTAGQERKDSYQCDITYGTNNEFGFDYLRDNMKTSWEQMVQGDLEYAIVDEVDSILIDEARTPLIISGPAFDDVTRYKKADQIGRQLLALQSGHDRIKGQGDAAERRIANAQGELSEAKKEKDRKRIERAQQAIAKAEQEMAEAEAKLAEATQYYEVEYDRKQVRMTDEGEKAAQDIAGMGSFYTGTNIDWPHLLQQTLRAHVVFEKEKDYVVMDGKVVIVDEFTGRLMQGRQWSDGLHQAVEAKEGVTVKEETQTLATVTLQNFFKLYEQIAGMTGTAVTEADEFMNIYKLDVVVMPTNKPCVRDDRDDVIYKTIKEKFGAIAEEINETSAGGRPVLVGTISIEKSEAISNALQKRFGLDHEVLNAKQHAREAQIVLKAGQQHKARDGKMRGNVTIATNMAGRGTDIKLGDGVAKAGGLHILGTERHEARRIDNQLRGRAGRQGDNGSSQFFLSFDDDLMVYFGGERILKLLTLVGWQEGEPIYHKRISRGIEKVQKKVEERNFEIRKSLLEYDEVMDYQRKIFYSRRRQVLEGRDLKTMIEEMIEATITNHCDSILDKEYSLKCIIEWARANFDVELKISDVAGTAPHDIEERIKRQARDAAKNNISLSLGEYLEDYADPSTWDVQGLCKWAMSAFQVNLSASKVKHQSHEEIEEQLVAAAGEQVDKKDCAPLGEFLKDGFAVRRLAEWARAKFDFKLDIQQLKDLGVKEVRDLIHTEIEEKYRRREIEYPVEFAMSMAYGPQGSNVYGFEALADWANKKYNADLSSEQMQDVKPRDVHSQLLELSESFNDGKLDEELAAKVGSLDRAELVNWANERFDATLSEEDLGEGAEATERLTEVGRKFLRRELADLERYVLLQVYDSTWKDHLYAMDHLKDSIWTRSLAEKDPKTEYKREGFRMFNDMLESIEDRVTDIIFRVHLEAGARTRNVWNVSQTTHDEVGQFAMAERQRAAAQAPQGEQKVKQIRLEQPKVGRNDPCPCGSGKKYKKCCGQNG